MWRFRLSTFTLFVVVLFVETTSTSASLNEEEKAAEEFLSNYDISISLLNNEQTKASWNYETNITEVNKNASLQLGAKYSDFNEEAFQNASRFNQSLIRDPIILRKLKFIGVRPLPPEEESELNSLISDMGGIYGSAKVCPPNSDEGCVGLKPELSNIMANSKNFTERTYYWREWQNVVGRALKPKYERYVTLKNKRAVRNGYTDYGDEWRSKYETNGTFEADIMKLYAELEPLYKDLHAYVRRKLNLIYGDDVINIRGKLPASVLSDIWGRFWNNLYKDLVPYPNKPNLDPTEEMIKQNYTVRKMFETGDNFYAAMGLYRVPDTFYNFSMLEKPADREVLCHATAWDFSDGKDFRIRMCTSDNNFDDLNTIHHELGHIQYYQHYKHLPFVFREGANDGFQEAIGELMAMSGATPKHLYALNLTNELIEDQEQDLNFLMRQALITISTLPFHLVNDLWRWKAYRNEFPIEEWNDQFWKLKESIVGVKAPVERTSEDLDPPSIYHICQDFDMIRYFVRTILQFQFAEKLCQVSGHEGPLHRCDFSGSKEAGAVLGKMLRLGRSVPWQDSLEQMTGTREMSARPILEFFKPLSDWLKKTNAENGDIPGWDNEARDDNKDNNNNKDSKENKNNDDNKNKKASDDDKKNKDNQDNNDSKN